MVKLFYMGVLYKREDNTVRCLKSAQDLQSFGFFQRNRYYILFYNIFAIHVYSTFIYHYSVGEFMKFTSKVLVERSDIATRSSVKQQGKLRLFVIKLFLSKLLTVFTFRICLPRLHTCWSSCRSNHIWPRISSSCCTYASHACFRWIHWNSALEPMAHFDRVVSF